MRLLKQVRERLGNYHLKSGIFHFYRKEFSQALEFLEKALQNPEKLAESDLRTTRYYLTQTRISAGEEAEEEGKPAQALEWYRSALTDSPRYPDIHFRVGMIQKSLGEEDQAILSFKSAIEIQPTYLDAHLELGFTLLNCDLSQEALLEFSRVRALTVAAIEEPYQAAHKAATSGEFETAAERMRDAFQRRPQSFAYHYHRGLRYLHAGRFEEAIADLEQAVQFSRQFADVHNYLGVACGELGELKRAVSEFRQAVECNPDYVAARLNLAFCLSDLGEHREAVTELKTVLSKEPSNQPALTRLEELTPPQGEKAQTS